MIVQKNTLKKISLLFSLFVASLSLLSTGKEADALPPTGDWSICVSQGWESDCGYYDLYGGGSEVVNRVIGGPDLADGLWNCAVLGVNGCRAVKTGTVSPSYVTETTVATTTTVDGGSSSPSTSSTTTTTVSSAPSLAHCPTAVCGYAVVDDQNYVYGVIVCSNACTGQRMTQSYMGCPPGCRLILQSQQTSNGNVAGWHGQGVKYDDNSQTFSLPSGGSIKSGDKLEDAVFPTTTTSTVVIQTSTPPTSTVPESQKSVKATEIIATGGTLYKSVEKYVASESQVVITSSKITLDLPVLPANDLSYSITFDPVGSKSKFTIKTGKIIYGVVVPDVSKQGIYPMAFIEVNSKVKTQITIDQKSLGVGSGVVIVLLKESDIYYADFKINVSSAKKYASCRALLRDYPGGVSAQANTVDKKTAKQTFRITARPTLNFRVFSLNQQFDRDKDRIICELNS